MFLLVLVLVSLGVGWLVWRAFPQPQAAKGKPTPTRATQPKNQARQQPQWMSQRVPTPIPSVSAGIPGALLEKLDRYTYNRETSTRLVQQVAANNPGRSNQWCAEKALFDLQRDRH